MEQSIQGPSRIFGRQPLKKFKRYGLLKQTIFLQIFKGCLPQILLGPFLNNLSHISHLSTIWVAPEYLHHGGMVELGRKYSLDRRN